MARQGLLARQPDARNGRGAAEARWSRRRSEIERSATTTVLQERDQIDQAEPVDRGGDLHASRLLADISAGTRARRPRPGLAGWLLLPLPPIEVRPCRPRVQKRARADQSRHPAAQVFVRYAGRDRRRREDRMRPAGPSHGRPREQGEAEARSARLRAWTAADAQSLPMSISSDEAANCAPLGAAQRRSRKRGGTI